MAEGETRGHGSPGTDNYLNRLDLRIVPGRGDAGAASWGIGAAPRAAAPGGGGTTGRSKWGVDGMGVRTERWSPRGEWHAAVPAGRYSAAALVR
ncbi:hypothetical protein GCM10009608_20160 [Pseudonocardia alaniniphila]